MYLQQAAFSLQSYCIVYRIGIPPVTLACGIKINLAHIFYEHFCVELRILGCMQSSTSMLISTKNGEPLFARFEPQEYLRKSATSKPRTGVSMQLTFFTSGRLSVDVFLHRSTLKYSRMQAHTMICCIWLEIENLIDS